MCSGPKKINPNTPAPSLTPETNTSTKDMNKPTGEVETENSFSSLLEFAANNDVEGFQKSIELNGSAIDEVGLWYVHQKVSKQMVLEHRTPLMVAAMYGSVDIVKLILSLSEADVNRSCGPDKSTALHCAVSGGSVNAVEVVKLLLLAGADPNSADAKGHRPFDVIDISPKLPDLKATLEELLKNDDSVYQQDFQVSNVSLKSNSPSLSSSPDNCSLSGVSESMSPPLTSRFSDIHVSAVPEKKEYPVDPSLPDIKNSIYATDEFRMYSFKIRPCSRAYSHDWTECPFVHPGENARRRDPRKFHYSCVPCPEFRKGACRRGDLCEYAHGVFECWLHPAQYRTRLCKDGTSCMRRVCFFAHASEELRPLYMSTGSGVASPRCAASAANAMDMALALSLFPGSPSAVSAMSPSPFTPPMSPAGVSIPHSSMAWPQQNIPTLHLPGSNLQMSRLRSSLSARDMPIEEFNVLHDFDVQQLQLLNDFSHFTQPNLSSASGNLSVRSKALTPSNLDELFSAEVSSPRYSDQVAASTIFSPSHKSLVLNQFQHQQGMLSPIKTNVFSPKNVDHPLLQASFGVPSPGRMSPRGIEPLSPLSSRLSSLAHREKQQQQHLRSLSSRDLGSNGAGIVNSPANSWSKQMGSAAVDKTEEELRKEIEELHRQQWEITERLRDPRGLRRGGLAAGGPRNLGANGARNRGFLRPADRTDPEDQPPPKRRLSSAIVKVEDGEITEDVEAAKGIEKDDSIMEDPAGDVPTAVNQSDRKPSNFRQTGWSRKEGNQRATKMDFEAPVTEHVPRVLPKNEDPSLVNRNKRMLGQLIGTLEKFRKEDVKLSGTEAFMRRSNSLQRAEQRAREESERLRQQEREQIAENRRRDLTLRARVAAKAEEKKLELLFLRWSEHHKKLCNYLRTKAEPPIYYSFSKPLEEDATVVEQQKEQVFLEWKTARREELSEYQKHIEEQYIANVEKELERWQNMRKARKANNDMQNLQETMDKELETHRLEHGPKTRKIPGGNNEDEEDVEDINVGEDDMMDDVLDVDENNRRAEETTKPEAGNASPHHDTGDE